MPDPQDWDALVEELSPVAETASKEYVEEMAKDEGNPDNPAEGEDNSPEEENTPDIPYRQFRSKKEHDDYMDNAFKSRVSKMQAEEAEKREEAEREATRKALEEQENFKGLYEESQKEIESLKARNTELKSTRDMADSYRETLETYADARVKELNIPKGTQGLLEKMDVKDRLDWLSEYGADYTPTERVPEPEDPDTGGTPEAEEAARSGTGDFIHSQF
jgi:hypothetical protein